MSRLRLNKIATPGTPAGNKGELYYSSTLSPAAPAWIDENGKVARVGGLWVAGATAAVVGLGATAFAAETYIAGSSINIGTPGAWKAGMVYRTVFDMTKTGAGTATPIILVRMGTLGTTGDATIQTFTFAVGTGVIDSAVFEIDLEFRSIGSGTSAVLAGTARCQHHLAATGMTTTGASGFGVILGASGGFDSTTSNIIGVSFNGGASFVGTNVMSEATLAA